MSSDSKDKTLEEPAAVALGSAVSATNAPRPWRYEILHEHARGGLGRVLVARDHELGRIVAVKELLTTGGAGEARFAREARLTARLEHPAVVPVHDAGIRPGAGTPFYAMKLVSGRPLDEAVHAAPTLAARLAFLPRVLAVCEALAYAHSRGVIHRDLKPANVLLGDYGETVVIDWGLAKERGEHRGADAGGATATDVNSLAGGVAPGITPDDDADDDLTATGTILGTPAYMAPEQARGEPVDERADVWALGAILYFVLAGDVPYTGKSGRGKILEILDGSPPPLESRIAGVPDDLAAIVSKAMAREPAARYAHAGELAADLERFLNGQLVAAHRYTAAERVARLARRHRGVAAATVVFVVAALAGGAAFVVREQRLRHEAQSARTRADAEHARADAERARAERMALGLLEQQARAELAAGRPRRAAPIVAELVARDGGRLVVRHLAAQVLAGLDAHAGDLVGHTRDVVGVAFSPDGALVVTAGNDTAYVWDAATGARLRELPGHTRPLNGVAMLPGGREVATSGGDQLILIHDVATGARLREISDPDPYQLAFAPDGTLWVGGHDGALRVYDPAGTRVAAWKPHSERVRTLAISPTGDRVVTGGLDEVLILWDLRTRRELARPRDHRGEIMGAAFSADGRWLVTADQSGLVRVREAATARVVATIEQPAEARASLLALTPDGQRLVTTSTDGVLRVWHLASGALLGAVDVEARGRVISCALAPDGELLVTGGPGGTAGRWRLPGGVRLLAPATPGVSVAMTTASWLDEGRLILAPVEQSLLGDGEVVVRRLADGAVVRRIHFALDPWNVVADPLGLRAAVASENMEHGADLGVFDLATGARLGSFALHDGRVFDAAVAPDGAWFVTAGRDGTVRRWDGVTGAPRGEPWRLAGRVSAVAVSADGTRVAAATDDGAITILDAGSGAVLGRIAAHASWIQDLAFAGDGTRLLSSGRQDRTGKVWSLPDGRLVATLAGHADNLFHGSLSRDGRVAATASIDGEVRLWDAATGELLRRVAGPGSTAALAPDGATLLVTGKGGYVAVIDVRAEVPADFAARAARSPWRLVDGRLSLAPP